MFCVVKNKTSEYVVTEAGFGSDLGAEKFFHIKCRINDSLETAANNKEVNNDLNVSCAVVVATLRALKLHGEGDWKKGIPNLMRHLDSLKKFNVDSVVAINAFPQDTETEFKELIQELKLRNVKVGSITCTLFHFTDSTIKTNYFKKLIKNVIKIINWV